MTSDIPPQVPPEAQASPQAAPEGPASPHIPTINKAHQHLQLQHTPGSPHGPGGPVGGRVPGLYPSVHTHTQTHGRPGEAYSIFRFPSIERKTHFWLCMNELCTFFPHILKKKKKLFWIGIYSIDTHEAIYTCFRIFFTTTVLRAWS